MKSNIAQLIGVGVGVGQIPVLKSLAAMSGQSDVHGDAPLKKQVPPKLLDKHQ